MRRALVGTVPGKCVLGVIDVSKPRLVSDTSSELALAALRPSEYTAALIQVLQTYPRLGLIPTAAQFPEYVMLHPS